MTNVVALPTAVQSVAISNEEFLRDVFGSRWQEAHVTLFAGDPALQGGSGAWSGGRAGTRLGVLERRDLNAYYCVSLCGDDPRTGRTARRADLARGMYCIMVDDVGTKVDPHLARTKLGLPSYQIETSPGNEQWIYKLDMPELDAGRVQAFWTGMLKLGLTADGKDPGSAGIVRYGRLPVGTNWKAAYGPRGHAHRVTGASPARIYTLDEVAQTAGLDLPPAGPVAAPAVAPPMDAGAADADLVFQALHELGWIQGATGSGWGYHCRCPYEDEHTSGRDGCAYRPGPRGYWFCNHGHCGGRGYGSFFAGMDKALSEAGLAPMRAREFVSEIVDTGEDVGCPGPRERFLGRWVYLAPDDLFHNLETRRNYGRRSLNSVCARELAGWTQYEAAKGATRHKPVDAWFFDQDEAQIAVDQAYWPGEAPVFELGGLRMVNTYRPPVLARRDRAVDKGEIRPWLDLVRHVLEAEGGRAVVRFLDWCAGVAANAAFKPAWMVVVHGGQGIGKDLIMRPLRAAVGEDNAEAITGDVLAGDFTGYAAKRLVVVSELRQTSKGSATGHDQYTRIKWLVDHTQPTLVVNPKYGKKFTARNTCAVFTSTNERNAVALEPDDRRAMVFLSKGAPRGNDYFAGLDAWFKSGGSELCAQWLAERWDRMGAARRAALSGRAPWTPGKAEMLRAGEDVVVAWVREQIEQDATPEWPDMITAAELVANVGRAAASGLHGLPRGRVLSADKAGQMLAGLGAVRVAGGAPVRLKSGRQVRLWAIRDQVRLATLGGAEAVKQLEAGVAAEFADGGDASLVV